MNTVVNWTDMYIVHHTASNTNKNLLDLLRVHRLTNLDFRLQKIKLKILVVCKTKQPHPLIDCFTESCMLLNSAFNVLNCLAC